MLLSGNEACICADFAQGDEKGEERRAERAATGCAEYVTLAGSGLVGGVPLAYTGQAVQTVHRYLARMRHPLSRSVPTAGQGPPSPGRFPARAARRPGATRATRKVAIMANKFSISKEKTAELVKEFGKGEGDSGSAEVQVAILSERIRNLTEHLKVHKKDNHTRRGLMMLIGKRRGMLKYIKNRDIDEYRALIKKLGIRDNI